MRIYKSAEGERAVRERYLEFLNRWPVRHERPRVATRFGETFVVACGPEDAPPLLLFHGAAANSAMWIFDIPAWARQFRVYAVDMIGEAGLSAPVRLPLDSEAHALWLDDVMQSLSIARASVVGVSLGGWLALNYATRRTERIERLAVLCPGGVGSQKVAIAFKLLALRGCGAWGKRKASELVLGRAPARVPANVQAFVDFVSLIHENFCPRLVKMPIFSDDALRRLTMPVLAILGAKDVLLDSAETRQRLERNVPGADIRYYPEAGHFIPRQTMPILEFLSGARHLTNALS